MKKLLLLPILSTFTLLGSCANNKTSVSLVNRDNGIEMVSVIFDAGDGVFEDTGLHAKAINVRKNYTWKIVKTIAPSGANIKYGDYNFIQWVQYSGAVIPDTYTFTSKETVLKAEYSGIEKIKLTLDPGTGTWDPEHSDDEDRIIEIPVGSTWGEYYQSYNTLYHDGTDVFLGFYKEGEDDPVPTDYEFTSDEGSQTFVARYGSSEVCNSFEKDSWSVFNRALSNGFESLFKKTHAEGGYNEEYIGNGSTFVGLTRKIHMYNSDYTIRVIGQDVDTLADGSGKRAVLTFEFVDAVDNGVGWSINPSINYNNATIRNYLNNEFINALPSDFASGLVEVSKKTYSGDAADPVVKEYNETIFLPSLNELGIKKILVEGIDPIIPKNEGFYDETTTDYVAPYSYYSVNRDLTKQYFANHNLPSTGAPTNYWVRSSDYYSTANAWYINSNGEASTDGSQFVNVGLAISPCFAMGA